MILIAEYTAWYGVLKKTMGVAFDNVLLGGERLERFYRAATECALDTAANSESIDFNCTFIPMRSCHVSWKPSRLVFDLLSLAAQYSERPRPGLS